IPHGDPGVILLLSETQPKSPCLRRDPRPKTTAFLPGAGENPELLRVFSSRDRRRRPGSTCSPSRRAAGSEPGCERSICLIGCGRCCSGSHCEPIVCELPCLVTNLWSCGAGRP